MLDIDSNIEIYLYREQEEEKVCVVEEVGV